MNYKVEKQSLPALLVKASLSQSHKTDSCLPAHFLFVVLCRIVLVLVFTTRERSEFEVLESDVSVALNAARFGSNNVEEKA